MEKGYRLSAATGLHKGDRDYQQDQVALFAHARANEIGRASCRERV